MPLGSVRAVQFRWAALTRPARQALLISVGASLSRFRLVCSEFFGGADEGRARVRWKAFDDHRDGVLCGGRGTESAWWWGQLRRHGGAGFVRTNRRRRRALYRAEPAWVAGRQSRWKWSIAMARENLAVVAQFHEMRGRATFRLQTKASEEPSSQHSR